MKLSLTLLLGIILFSLAAWAGPSSNSEYFICHFSDTITQSEINELSKQGFQVVEETENHRVIYVKAKPSAYFSTVLKSKMEKIVQVDQHGNHTIILEEEIIDESPDFLRLFFNFI